MGMDPATMLLVGQMTGSGVSALGSIQEGKQAKKIAKYQRRQTEADAAAALSIAKLEAQKIRQAGSAAQSQAVAAMAGSGVAVGEGTTGLIEQTIRQRSEEDAQTTIYDGLDAFRRGLVQAQSYKAQGKAASDAAFANTFSSLLNFGVAGIGLAMNWLGKKEGGTTPSSTGGQ